MIEIAEDPFVRPRADARVGHCCLAPKHVLLEQLRRLFSCISLSVIPLIMKNGGGLKKSLQITPSLVRERSYKHEAVGAEGT